MKNTIYIPAETMHNDPPLFNIMCYNKKAAGITGTFLCLSLSAVLALPSFPGAEGFGAAATGGSRNPGQPQQVYRVTTVKDDGPGSFRDAISAPGRVIVFDVGGYIHIGKRLHVPDNTTIAGETAPGDGICFKDEEVDLTRSKNIIIRNVRFRQGTDFGHVHQYSIGAAGSNIIMDHCSIEWGRWDCIGLTNGTNITFQSCIIGEGLDPQRFGALVYSDNITFKSCLWINNHGRNPKGCGKIQYVNNVAYNWQTGGYDLGHSQKETWHDIIGNYYINGPVSRRGFYYGVNALCHVYQSGNLYDGNCDGILNGTPVNVEGADNLQAPWARTPVPITATTARVAYKEAISDVGVNPPHRDPLDARLIGDLTSLGTKGRMADFVADAGGWVPLRSGPPAVDTDRDGLPDYWELAFPPYTATGMSADGMSRSGYTNLEDYLHWKAGPHAVVAKRTAGNTFVNVNLRDYTSGYKPQVTYMITINPAHGTATLIADRSDPAGTPLHVVRYEPSLNYVGPDAFVFNGTDADGDVTTRKVSVLVSPRLR